MNTRMNESDSVHELTASELQAVKGGVKAVCDEMGNPVATCTTYLDINNRWRPLHLPPYDGHKPSLDVTI